MIEQAEILEDDADAAAQQRQFAARDGRNVAVEHADQAARRLQRHEQQAQKRRLAGARGAGQELERLFRNVEGQVPEDFRAHAVTQTDIFKMNQRAAQSVRGFDRMTC